MDPLRPRSKFAPPLAHRLERRVQRLRQLVLHLDVADLAGAIARLQVVDLGDIRVEHVVIQEDRVALDRARHVGPDPLRIGVHRAHFLLHAVGVLGQQNRVPEALAHLLAAVESRQPRHFRQQRLRLDEHVAVKPVEPADHLARQLEMRDLIVADRNEIGVVDRDVGRLQQRITRGTRSTTDPCRSARPAVPCRSARARATTPGSSSRAADTARRARAPSTARRTCCVRDRGRRRSSRWRCRRRTASAGSCRRSRSSARASRPRSRSSRTAPAAPPSSAARRRGGRGAASLSAACRRRRVFVESHAATRESDNTAGR